MAIDSSASFSIIVPVYNGATVIERCIKSVLEQTYPTYELILVDDGSKDGTGEICKQYTAQDTRIRYYYQTNKGVSATRNQGLRLAQNEFVLFVDADDFISPTYLSHFCQLLVNEQLNDKTLVFQDFVADVQYKDGGKESFNWCKLEYAKYSLKEAYQKLEQFDWLYFGVPFAKLYRLSLIREHNIAFNEVMSFKEDLIFLLDYIRHVDTILFDSIANYHYVIQKDKLSLSNTTAGFDNEVFFFHYVKQMADHYTKQFELSKKAQQVMNYLVYNAFFRCMNSCMYQYKIPMSRINRLKNIRTLATKENLQRLSISGVIDTKMKQLALMLLRSRLFTVYDMLNKMRYRLT
jgi:glycosyltransferase involved in cell wall biosynthesis